MPIAVEHALQFVDQRDVDRAIGVFQDLARFGDARARHRHDAVDDRLVQRDGQLAAGLVEAADDLGDVARRDNRDCRDLRARG